MKSNLLGIFLLSIIFSCHKNSINSKDPVFGKMIFSRDRILCAAFEWNKGRMILAPQNTDTVFLLKNAYTDTLNIRCKNGKTYISLTLLELKKRKKGYIILDRIIYGSNYAVISLFGYGESYFTGIVRNIDGKPVLTDPSFSYDLYKYSKMKADGYVN